MQAKTILIIACTALLLAACTAPAKKTLIDTIPNTSNELLYHDVLSGEFTSRNITVLGVSVGMTEADVTAKLGAADSAEEFDFGAVKNWGYAEKLGFTETAVLYHIEKGVVTRIVVGPALNHFLTGESIVGKNKSAIYSDFGIPQRQYDMKAGRFFVYNKLGLEEYLNTRDIETQYALVYPMRKLPSLAYENTTVNPLETPVPVLITDTTTLCDQGITFGTDPASGECKWFKNSCDIPDNWIEVSTCSNSTNVVNITTTNVTNTTTNNS